MNSDNWGPALLVLTMAFVTLVIWLSVAWALYASDMLYHAGVAIIGIVAAFFLGRWSR